MLAPNRCGTARDCPPGLSPEGRTGRAVSRVLFSRACAREDGHLSGTTVAGRLERPTRGSPLAHARDLVVWVTPRRLFGLAPTGGCRATVRCRRCGGLLPHLFTLTPRLRSGRCLFCGPVRRLAAPRRYLAVYPLELGLSSGRPKAPATTALDPPRKANSPALLGPTAPRRRGAALGSLDPAGGDGEARTPGWPVGAHGLLQQRALELFPALPAVGQILLERAHGRAAEAGRHVGAGPLEGSRALRDVPRDYDPAGAEEGRLARQGL